MDDKEEVGFDAEEFIEQWQRSIKEGMKPEQLMLRQLVKSLESIQKVRIQVGNRLAASKRVQLGLNPSSKEESENMAHKILKQLRDCYDKITEGLVRLPPATKFKGVGILDSYVELLMMQNYLQLLKQEEELERRLGSNLPEFPLWTEYLQHVKGCGPKTAAYILAYVNPYKMEKPSSLWKYSGYDVAEDGRGRGRYKAHLVKKKYKDSKGKITEADGVTFRPGLKGALWKMAESMLKLGLKLEEVSDEEFDNAAEHCRSLTSKGIRKDVPCVRMPTTHLGKCYIDRRHYEYTRPDAIRRKSKAGKEGEQKDLGIDAKRVHDRCRRYMIKQFLTEVYEVWRALEGLTVAPPYEVWKFGKTPHRGPRDTATGYRFTGYLKDAEEDAREAA